MGLRTGVPACQRVLRLLRLRRAGGSTARRRNSYNAAAALLVVTGVLWWSSLFIAIPSFSAMLSAAVRIRATR